MSGLKRRENGIYYYGFIDPNSGNYRWISLGTKRLPDAKVKRIEKDNELALGKTIETITGEPTAEWLWHRYLKEFGPMLAPKTVAGYTDSYRWLCREFCPDRLSDLAPSLLRKHRASWTGSPVTYNDHIRRLSTIVRSLGKGLPRKPGLGVYHGPNPFEHVPYMDEPDDDLPVLSWDQIETLAWWGANHYRSFNDHGGGNRTNIHMVYVLGGYFGLRAGEISAARWEHLDWRLGTLRVVSDEEFQTKARKSRVIPLFNNARPWLEAERQDSGFIYNPRRNSPVCDFGRAFRTVAAQAGMPDIYPHLLRHSFVSNKLMDGKVPAKVAMWSGHTTLSIQEKYKNYIPHTQEDLD